jgi:glycogen debranching enzyme
MRTARQSSFAELVLTILEGSTFCICDDSGDIDGQVAGFFADDTRFLSRFSLRVNGIRPSLLSFGKVDYFSAAFYLRSPPIEGLPPSAFIISRARFVGEGLQDYIEIENLLNIPLELELSLELAADFADIITVKEHDFTLGESVHPHPLPPPVAPRFDVGTGQLVFADKETMLRTQVIFTQAGEPSPEGMRFPVSLDPRSLWRLRVDVGATEDPLAPSHLVERRFGEELDRVRESLAAWHLRVPSLTASWPSLQRAFDRSVADLASLRLRERGHIGRVPAAGMPWFMTLFGRDTLITSLQTLILGPELAYAALQALADLQATEDDAEIDAEPGKILHELRRGKTAERWFPRYYGSIDATPLFLIVLSELWRWTGDDLIVRTFREPALKALRWIDRYGDRDGDGFVEYERRSHRGLENQSWKDSGNSQAFADGRQAVPPIAPCEAQGYVYDAKLRVAQLARGVWRDRELAERLEREAGELRERFDEAFWIESRGGYFALALDGDKQPVDSLTSNIGHLLWSNIIKPQRVDHVVDRLLGEELWSGWGVRTMSNRDAAYSPLAYHNGTVWPHDNSLIALGLASCGRWPEALTIAAQLFGAAERFEYQLPEVFAGLSNVEWPFPIAYPTSARPQAWAAGTPVLLLQILLGLRPDRVRGALVSDAPELPAWVGRIRLTAVRALGRSWDVRLEQGRVTVEELP